MKDNSYNDSYSKEEEEGIDFQKLLMIFLINWKWCVLSVIVCMAGAFVYLRYATPLYRITAKVMIKDTKKGGYTSEMVALEDLGFLNSTGGIDNEIEVLLSKSLIKRTVMDLKLYTSYYEEGRFKDRDLYNQSPIWVDLEHGKAADLKVGFLLTFSPKEDSTFVVEYKTVDENGEPVEKEEKISKLPYLLETINGNLIISRNPAVELSLDRKLKVSIRPPLNTAKSYLANLTVEPTSKTTSVAVISIVNSNRKRGEDFLNELIATYNEDANNDKNVIAQKTEDFIAERIEIVGKELNQTEGDVQNFKVRSGLVNLVSDAEQALKETSDYEKKRVEVNTQLNLVQMLSDYVFDPSNNLKTLPTNIGLTDAALTQMITTYNAQILQRDRLLRTATESNPAVMSITAIAEGLLDNIKTAIVNLKNGLTISKNNIEREVAKYTGRISSAPVQEREFAGIARQQEIKSGLYLMLLQKREENSIALAATADNAKIIDDALAEEIPLSPKRSMIWLIAFVMGIAIPIGVLYVLNLFRYKISGRPDVEKLTNISILGEVPIAEELEKGERAVVVREDSNDLMAETFRAIRTNLNFVLTNPNSKVVLFTSTTATEGKTFISSNLAVSLALLGKKVILCGLDIRKPRLVDLFKLTDKKRGITTFLAGDANDKELLFNQIMNSGINPNLDLLPSGVIPPNPAELLAKENLDKAIEYLSEKYDYILLDTAPVGLVADTLLIGRVANASIYVCRAEHTPKADFEFINELYKENKLPHMSLVINAVDLEKGGYYYGSGKYGYKNRYGYRYNYGYGYGMNSNNKSGKKKKK